MANDNRMYLSTNDNGHNDTIIPTNSTHDDKNATSGEYLDRSEDGHNGAIIPPDINHNEAAMMNPTNATAHAAGEPVQNTTNHTANASTAAHKLPATSNPILALYSVCAVLAGASFRRKI